MKSSSNPMNWILQLFYLFESFSHRSYLMIFYWSPRDSKSLKVFRNLLCILADLNNAVVWVVSTRPLISKSSSSCINPLVTVSNVVFNLSLSDSKSLKVFRNLLCILADLNNAVVWVVSTRPLMSNYFSAFSKSLRNVPFALITLSFTVTIFSVLLRGLRICISFRFLLFHFPSVIGWNGNNHKLRNSVHC